MFISPAEQNSGIYIIEVGPFLDMRNARIFQDRCDELIRDRTRYIVIDFSGTGMLDSTGFGQLMYLHKRLSAWGGRLAVAAAEGTVRTVLELTRCERIFGNYATPNAAVSALSGS